MIRHIDPTLSSAGFILERATIRTMVDFPVTYNFIAANRLTHILCLVPCGQSARLWSCSYLLGFVSSEQQLAFTSLAR